MILKLIILEHLHHKQGHWWFVFLILDMHCVKSVQIRSYIGKYGTEITPYLDNFHTVMHLLLLSIFTKTLKHQKRINLEI